MRFAFAFAVASSISVLAPAALAAPPAPSGPHPRIWLTAPTMAALKTNAATKGSAAAAAVAQCDDAVKNPNKYNDGIFMGYGWGYAGASCGLAWQLTKDAKYATAGLRFFNALLYDFQTIGDGAGGDSAETHDGGYSMRYFGAFSAIAYDWFHDAPGADQLLPRARDLFKTWVEWYEASGYLKDAAGSNYHAGYLLAKTMISIAASGEDDGSAAKYWADVVDNMFKVEIVQKGITGSGALVGGDWPEGWEYGPLGCLEYSMSARALEEQGVPQPEMHQWASDLVLNYHYALTPDLSGFYAGGDYGTAVVNAVPSPEPLLAAMAGLGSDEAAGWAAAIRPTAAKDPDECLVYDALAEARGAKATSFTATPRPLFYVTKGTRKLYARSSWDPGAFWGVFVSAPKFGVDHQHLDASTFEFARGKDTLVSDPSPYGSLSTLTTNALSVDSQTVQDNYRPSQSPYSIADLAWARATESGVAAGRAALEGAFADTNGKSDVPYARRDWTFLPEGEIVAIDRVRTDDPARKTYLRFRTPGTFALGAGNVATATVSGSQLVVHLVTLSGGTPQVRSIKGDNGAPCDGTNFGVCTAARIDTGEYAVEVPGPSALAVHVLDGTGAQEAPAEAVAIGDPAVVGARITRGGARSFVLASSAKDGAPGATLAYSVPGDTKARHVVFDAPEDARGTSNVTAQPNGDACAIAITAGSGDTAFAGRPLVFDVTAAKDGCALTEDKTVTPATAPPGDGGTNPAAPAAPGGGASGSSGCGCRLRAPADDASAALALFGLTLTFAAARSRRRRR